MKRLRTIICLFVFVATLCAQTSSRSDFRNANQTFIIIEGNNKSEWVKGDVDVQPTPNNQTYANENVSFNASSGGIFIIINSGKNKVKLFALTGQLLLDGELTQGRFFIPTKQGIYFLRVNTKSYKIICK